MATWEQHGYMRAMGATWLHESNGSNMATWEQWEQHSYIRATWLHGSNMATWEQHGYVGAMGATWLRGSNESNIATWEQHGYMPATYLHSYFTISSLSIATTRSYINLICIGGSRSLLVGLDGSAESVIVCME